MTTARATRSLPAVSTPGWQTGLSSLWDLGKPRLTALVVMTGAFGFYVAPGAAGILTFVALLAGLWLTSAGAAGMNMVLEEDTDRKMRRTMNRPVPSGRVSPGIALVFSIGIFFLGFVVLFVLVNPLTAGLAHLTGAIYALVYTPLKKYGPLSTFIGAIPGAIPPVMGWTAVQGQIDPEAIALFGILFLWQFPHFLALAWMYKDDYARGGFDFSIENTSGTCRTMLVTSISLIVVSLTLFTLGAAGWFYAIGATLIGLYFFRSVVRLEIQRTLGDARKVFFASITYLPVLLALVVVDRLLFG